MRIARLPGVFAPHSDSWLLAWALASEPGIRGSRVLDLCTGSGVVALCSAEAGAEVTAVDLSRRAVTTARLNAALNGVRVRSVRGRLFEPVAGQRFDFIVSNPPYLPGSDGELPRRGAQRAWEGGEDGRALLDPILDGAPAHLRPGGTVLVVHSSVCGVQPTLGRLASAGLHARVSQRHRGPMGPLLAARAATLAERGLIERGQRFEEVVVVRAEAPGGREAQRGGAVAAGLELH